MSEEQAGTSTISASAYWERSFFFHIRDSLLVDGRTHDRLSTTCILVSDVWLLGAFFLFIVFELDDHEETMGFFVGLKSRSKLHGRAEGFAIRNECTRES